MKTKTEMHPIYKRNRLYHMLRYYVDCMIRNSYNTIAARGKDNIPDEGIIIIAPNHSNALMDPLLILQSSKKATLFGARADVFTPAFRKALHFLKIVPMIRRRDGFRNAVHNIETIETITEALGHGMPFCMFCEGTHRTMHSLLPLTKGIARIACEAYRKESAKAPEKRKPVYIIPAGIEYADYFRFRHSAVITFGRPIEITDTPDTANTAYMCNPTETGNKTYIQVPPDIKKILATLHTSMSQLITYLPDDREYDRKFTLLRLHSPINEKKPAETLENNRKHAEEIEQAIAFDSLAPMLDRFEELRQKKRISYHSFNRNGKRPGTKETVFGTARAIIELPYFIYSTVAMAPVLIAAQIITSKVQDRAFHNTVRFATLLALYPVTIAAITAIAFSLLQWQTALILTLLALPAHNFAHDYIFRLRVLISDIRYTRCKELKKLYDTLTLEIIK